MNEFSIGEVAIFVRPGSRYYGIEVTVTSDLRLCQIKRPRERQRERLGDWELCPWQPETVEETTEAIA